MSEHPENKSEVAETKPRSFPTRRVVVIGLLLFAVAVGLAMGVGSYTFIYAKGASYLTNDPQTCANCHIMQGHLDAWRKSSHHAVAVCNDCHAPSNFVGKWMTKGINGWNHSLAFTTQRFHEPLMITEMNLKITEGQCRKCHQAIVRQIDVAHHAGGEKMSCVRCHNDVGHPR